VFRFGPDQNDGARLVLGRDQRDDILKAVNAIEHQLTATPGKPRWQALSASA